MILLLRLVWSTPLSVAGAVFFCPLLAFCFPPARGQSHRDFIMYAAHTAAAAATATTATASTVPLPRRIVLGDSAYVRHHVLVQSCGLVCVSLSENYCATDKFLSVIFCTIDVCSETDVV